MKKNNFLLPALMLSLAFLSVNNITKAQNIGINGTGAAPDAGAMLDISATNKGLLIPRVNIANLNTIAPVVGSATVSMLVYNTNATTGVGYHYWNGATWVKFNTGGDAWQITGNANTTFGTNFLGTTNAQGVDFRTNNTIRLRIPNANQVWANANGTAALPFYSRSTDANTGMYFSAADQLSWSTGGTERLRLRNVQLSTTFSGSAGVPAYSFTTDTDIGMYRIGANNLGFSSSGIERFRLTATSAVFNELSNDYDFRIESNNQANTFSVNGGTDQIGFFIANSPFGVIKMEANFNDAAFPWVRFINTNAGGTSFMGVGQNDASGGTWAIGAGMSGTADSGPGVSGYANSITVQAFGGYFENDGAFANVGGWQSGPWVMRKIVGNGTVNTIVDGLNSNEKVTMTCPEAPEVVFQDYGIGELINGYAKIDLDPIFSKNIIVDKDHPIKVYIQLEGECNGVYVFNKSDLSFEVKELNNGNSNISFSWMVVANRSDVEVKYSDGTSKISNFSKARFSPAPKYTPPASLNDNKRVMIEYKSIKP